MSSRVAATALALIAAALLAISVATSAWWSGHPVVDGRTSNLRTVYVGPMSATGCKTGGDGSCQKLPIDGGFAATGIAETVALVLLVIGLLALAGLAWKRSEHRKLLATVALAAAGLSIALAAAMILQGPAIKGQHRVVMPIGYGMYLFWIGAAGAIAASLVARREMPEPRTTLRPPRQLEPAWSAAPAMVPPPAGPPVRPSQVDVQALLQDDSLRPSSLGPEPMMGRPPVASPGGSLPGPSGPLGAGGQAPLFTSAPQLKPLYEQFGHGVAKPHVDVGMTPPMIPRAQIAALTGVPAPATAAPRPPPPAVAPAPPLRCRGRPRPRRRCRRPRRRCRRRSRRVHPARRARRRPRCRPRCARGPSVPPPVRPRSASAAPPIGSSAVAAAPSAAAARTAAALPGRPLKPSRPLPPPTAAARAEQPTPPPIRPATESVQTLDDPTVPPVEVGDHTDVSASPAAAAFGANRAGRAGTEDDDQASTHAVEKVGATDVELAPAPPEPERTEPEAVAAPPEPAPAPPKQKAATISTAPASLPPPTEKQAQTSGPSPACPQCEAPMAWVEEHLRFYCKSCKMYF